MWEVCPFFPSGTVIASDMQTGLYVYRPVRDYGHHARGRRRRPIWRAATRAAASPAGCCCSPNVVHLRRLARRPPDGGGSGAEVYLTTQGDSLTTPADGIVQFAPSPGTHTVTGEEVRLLRREPPR